MIERVLSQEVNGNVSMVLRCSLTGHTVKVVASEREPNGLPVKGLFLRLEEVKPPVPQHITGEAPPHEVSAEGQRMNLEAALERVKDMNKTWIGENQCK